MEMNIDLHDAPVETVEAVVLRSHLARHQIPSLPVRSRLLSI